MRAAVEGACDRACEAEFVGVRRDTHVAIDDGHGRHEERGVTVLYRPEGLPVEWVGARAVVQVCRERVAGGVRTSTTHYSLSSHAGSAAVLAGVIRGHWGIEAMHWVLDVVFGEDDSRVRERHAGANLAWPCFGRWRWRCSAEHPDGRRGDHPDQAEAGRLG